MDAGIFPSRIALKNKEFVMKIPALTGVVLVAALTVSNFVAEAATITVARTENGVMPVLVSIDKTGTVQKIQATEQLKPAYARLLRKNIQEMITAPAKDGERYVDSQVVMRVRLIADPASGGDYTAHYVAADSTPTMVPLGAWSWSIVGGRYSLVQNIGSSRGEVVAANSGLSPISVGFRPPSGK